MAFSEYVITTWQEIPALIAQFAAAQGWTVSSTAAGQPSYTIRRPVSANPAETPDTDLAVGDVTVFTISWDDTASVKALKIDSSRQASANDALLCLQPRFNGTGATWDTVPPTKLFAFGEGLPGPWLTFVVQLGTAGFRQIYFGSLDRIGSFKSGCCAAVTSMVPYSLRTGFPRSALPYVINLFRSAYETNSGFYNGTIVGALLKRQAGVYVNLPAEGATWRKAGNAFLNASSFKAQHNTNEVMGGDGDGIDDLLVSHGFGDYAGQQYIWPISLFAPVIGGNNSRYRPLGRVRGIRRVNMKNLEPNQQIEVGSKIYRVFPSTRKSSNSNIETDITSGSYGNMKADNSLYFGTAILEGDA